MSTMEAFGATILILALLAGLMLLLLSPALIAVLVSKSPVFGLHVTTRRRVQRIVASEGPIVASGVYRGFIAEPSVTTTEEDELVEAMCPVAVERAAGMCRAYGVAWMVLAIPIGVGVLYEIGQVGLGPFTLLGGPGLALAIAALSVRSDLLRMKPNAPRAARVLCGCVLLHVIGIGAGVVEGAHPSGRWQILSLEYFGFIPIVGILLSAIVAGELARALGPFKEALAQAEPVERTS
jgi:hypothetical protein